MWGKYWFLLFVLCTKGRETDLLSGLTGLCGCHRQRSCLSIYWSLLCIYVMSVSWSCQHFICHCFIVLLWRFCTSFGVYDTLTSTLHYNTAWGCVFSLDGFDSVYSLECVCFWGVLVKAIDTKSGGRNKDLLSKK